MTSLDSTSRFSSAGLVDQFGEFEDFLAERGRIVGGDQVFKLGDDFLLFVFGQVFEIVGQPLVDLRLAVAFRVGENFFAFFLHALQAAADGVDAGGEPALEHRHGEAERPATGGVFGRGFDGLVLDEAGQRVVEVPFVVVDLKLGGLDIALGEQRLDLAGFRVRESDEASLTRRR